MVYDLRGADEDVAGGYEAVLEGVALLEAREGVDHVGGVEVLRAIGGYSPLGAGAAPYVVVGYACAYYYVEYAGVAAGASGYSGVDDEVGVEGVDECDGAHCGVDFAYAAFHGYDVLA